MNLGKVIYAVTRSDITILSQITSTETIWRPGSTRLPANLVVVSVHT